jgi:hypothetical protein
MQRRKTSNYIRIGWLVLGFKKCPQMAVFKVPNNTFPSPMPVLRMIYYLQHLYGTSEAL